MSMATMPPILSLEATAEHLECAPLAVKRLIARGVIPGHRLGDDGTERLFSRDVLAFIEKNCPDLDPPEINSNGWLEPVSRHAFIGAKNRVLAIAIEEQRIPDSRLSEIVESRPSRDKTFSFELRVTTAVREAWQERRQSLGVKFANRPATDEPFATTGQRILAGMLCQTLAGFEREIPMRERDSSSRLGTVYYSRERYEDFKNRTVDAVYDASLMDFETRPVSTRTSTVRVEYLLPLSKLLPGGSVNGKQLLRQVFIEIT